MTDRTRRQVLAGTGLVAVAGLAGCISSDRDAETTTNDTYALEGASSLRVTNENGEIALRGEDRSDVAVTGHKQAASEDDFDAIGVEATRSGDALELSVERDDGGFIVRLGPQPKMDLEVAVPADLRVERVETVNGDLDVSGVRGDLEAETTNGDVTLTDVRGDADATTTNGNVEVVGIRGDVSAETTNGDISATDVAGEVTTDTTNGDVDVQNVSGSVSRE